MTSKAEEGLCPYALDANSCPSKPVFVQGLAESMRILSQDWFEIVKLPNRGHERKSLVDNEYLPGFWFFCGGREIGQSLEQADFGFVGVVFRRR